MKCSSDQNDFLKSRMEYFRENGRFSRFFWRNEHKSSKCEQTTSIHYTVGFLLLLQLLSARPGGSVGQSLAGRCSRRRKRRCSLLRNEPCDHSCRTPRICFSPFFLVRSRCGALFFFSLHSFPSTPLYASSVPIAPAF